MTSGTKPRSTEVSRNDRSTPGIVPIRFLLAFTSVLFGSGLASYGWNELTPLTNVVVCPGENATFSTVASGAKPWKFSWYKDGAVIPGRTNSSLTITNVSAASVGTYTVILKGGYNNVTNSATLALKTPVSITPLTNLVRSIGANAVFSTVASGTGPFTYQWKKGNTVLTGKTQSSLLLTNLTLNDSGTYTVIVNGACGSSATNSATLTVDTCFASVDVMLVLDRSGSMTGKPYDDARKAGTNFVRNLHMLPSADQAGLASYNSTATLDQKLTNKLSVLEQAINSIPGPSGQTSITLGLQTGQAELASIRHNSLALPVIVLLSDGLPTGSDTKSNALYAATQAKNAGTRIFTVGLGEVDHALMAGIASSPGDYFYTTNSAQLTELFDAISTIICRPPTNNAPTAVNDTYTTPEDTVLNITAPGVLANDTDSDTNNILSAVLVSGVMHGSLALAANGGFVYTPTNNYFGPDSFTYRANDGKTNSNVATVSITVTPINDPPIAANDSYTTAEDTTLNISAPGVLANDSDLDGGVLSAVLVNGPAHGTLVLNTNGGFTYTPALNYTGPDSFTYRANDGLADSGIATAAITVTPLNDPPVAIDDSYSTPEDTILNIVAPGVLANDSDVESSPLTAVLVNGPAHGTVTLNTNGGFNYSPALNYTGPDSFTYRANDGSLNSAVATVSITVTPVNDAPIAVNDSYSTPEDTALNILAPGVLANDSDADGNALTAALVTGPAHGALTLNGDGSFNYTPAIDYTGPDAFSYRANDGQTNSAVANVSITVTPLNDPPIANNQNVTTPEDTAKAITLTGSDIEGAAITFAIVTGPAHGTLSLLDTNTGAVTYTPGLDYNGPDSFTFRVSDGQTNSAVATVSITVTPVNDPPIIRSPRTVFTTLEDTPLIEPPVLDGIEDADGDPLSVVLITGTAHGSLNLNTNGGFTYSPTADYFGPDSFQIQITDGVTNTPTFTLSITVIPVNDAPSFTKGPDRVVQQNSGISITGWATGISAGPDNETLQIVNFMVSNDNNALFSGQPIIDGLGMLQFTPAPNTFGVANVTVQAHDNGGTANGGVDTSAPQTFKIIVNGPPTVSIINPTNGTVFLAPATFGIAANAQDPDGTVTNVQFFISGTNLVGESAIGNPFTTILPDVPLGTNILTARAIDNYGATGTSAPVSIVVRARPPLTTNVAVHFNPQSGLYEQSVRVTNPTYSMFNAVRIYILTGTNAVHVYNPSGVTNGVPYVQSSVPVPPGSYVDFVIEYYVTAGGVVPNPILLPELVQSPGGGGVSVIGTQLRINRGFMQPDGNFVVEFASQTNRLYYVQYTGALNTNNWKTALPAISGNGTWIQWIDNGQPKTESAPPVTDARFYRVILLP
jgi:VCBS repeat-containing protein